MRLSRGKAVFTFPIMCRVLQLTISLGSAMLLCLLRLAVLRRFGGLREFLDPALA
jgi:hypothetical protein